MSEKTPLAEAGEVSREERLLERLNGLIQYQSELLGQVRRKGFRPYCHVPDLFNLDPEATRPYTVPDSFISEQVGGNVSVVNTNGGYLDTEPLDLMLSSYLPGGYKRRWNFELWTGDFDAASERGFADIESGLRISAQTSLRDLLPDTTKEGYTPYEYSPDDVEIYVPNRFLVWNPSVGENNEFTHFYWDERNGVVWNQKPEGVPDEDLRELSGDPTSQFLWFKHPLDFGSEMETLDTVGRSEGLIESAMFSDDATFLKSYYATLLTLYGEDRTFSEVIRYRHERDDAIAFVGSREESQVLLFDLDRDVLADVLEQAVVEDTALYRDMQFALLYRRLWDRLFFQEEALGHAFSVTPFYRAFEGLDYLMATGTGPPETVFEADLATIHDRLETLLPEEGRRLGLFDYDTADLDEYRAVIADHEATLGEIVTECTNTTTVREFAEHVLVHSLKHAIASWAAEYSAGGSDFEAWYDVNFHDSGPDPVQLGIYDSIQGGAGVSREVFEDLESIGAETLLTGLAEQGCCHIAATEETLVSLLQEFSGEYLFDTVQSLSGSREEPMTELKAAYENLSPDYRHIDYDEIQPLLHRRLRALAETQELARFYGVVADEYVATRDRIGRSPRPVDLVFALEDRTFFDSRVQRTYQRFANRRSQRRDLSEVAERVEEITKQCVHACPDCLKRQSCTHQYRYQEQMLDRRLLVRALAPLEEVV